MTIRKGNNMTLGVLANTMNDHSVNLSQKLFTQSKQLGNLFSSQNPSIASTTSKLGFLSPQEREAPNQTIQESEPLLAQPAQIYPTVNDSDAVDPELQQIITAINMNVITSTDQKTQAFFEAVVTGLNRIHNFNATSDNRLIEVNLENMLKRISSGNYKEYLPDLQRGCKYLLRNIPKKQDTEALLNRIDNALITFKTIDELLKVQKKYGEAITAQNFNVTQDPTQQSPRKQEIEEIVAKFNKQINSTSISGSKYGFKVAAGASLTGAAGGAASSGISVMLGTFASLKSIATAIVAALGIGLGGAAAAIALPITGGLAAGFALGAGGFKGYQYYQDNQALNRLKALNNSQAEEPSSTAAEEHSNPATKEDSYYDLSFSTDTENRAREEREKDAFNSKLNSTGYAAIDYNPETYYAIRKQQLARNPPSTQLLSKCTDPDNPFLRTRYSNFDEGNWKKQSPAASYKLYLRSYSTKKK